MLRNLIVLPDGTEIFSGVVGDNAIKSVQITHCVNSQTELTIGSVCTSMLDASVISPYGGLSIEAGAEVTAYKVDDSGTRHLVGLYTLEKPTRPSANTYKIVAYDRISRLDKDLSQWLANLNVWPIPLLEFAQMVCAECGLTLINDTIPNADYQIQQFSGDGITGRKLMQWCGEACARFLRATPDGDVEFAWYTDTATKITPSGSNGGIYYMGGSLSYEDYEVVPIEKVQIRSTADDIGVMYPDIEGEANTYMITGNYLLTASTTDDLLPVAETIHREIRNFVYRPCKVSIPASLGVTAGDIITITDINGITFRTIVMQKTQKGQKDTLECTGSHRRDSSTARHEESYAALNGKILEVKKEVDGLRVTNKDTQGKLAEILLDVDGVRTEVSAQTEEMGNIREQMTQIQQSATEVSIRVQNIIDNGVDKVVTGMGYSFTDDGLHVQKDGEGIKSKLDHTGLVVADGDDPTLEATADGVNAKNLTARYYLTVPHSRFEAYYDVDLDECTGCFPF